MANTSIWQPRGQPSVVGDGWRRGTVARSPCGRPAVSTGWPTMQSHGQHSTSASSNRPRTSHHQHQYPAWRPGGRAVSHPRPAPASQSCGCSVMGTVRPDARSETAGRSRDRPPGLEVVGLAVGCELGIEDGVGSGSAQGQDRGIAAAAAECLASRLARRLIGDARAPARAPARMRAPCEGRRRGGRLPQTAAARTTAGQAAWPLQAAPRPAVKAAAATTAATISASPTPP